MRILIFVFTVLVCPQFLAQNKRWEVLERNGDPFVSVKNIEQFYLFNSSETLPESQSVKLSYPKMELEFDVRNQQFLVNQVKFKTVEKLIWDRDSNDILVNAVDLANLIDPVIRPTQLEEKPRINLQLEGDQALISKLKFPKLKSRLEDKGIEFHDSGIPIAINLKTNRKSKKPQVNSQWKYELPPANGIRPTSNPHKSRVALVTAIHSQLFSIFRNEKSIINPGDRTEIQIQIDENFKDYQTISDALFIGISRYLNVTAKQ